MPSSPGIGMHVEVRDPDDKVVLSRVYSSEGRISFTSHTPGEHVICLYSNSTAWFSGGQLVSILLEIRLTELILRISLRSVPCNNFLFEICGLTNIFL